MSISVHEHYRRLLLLPEPWEVTKVEEDLIGQRVTVWLRWPDGVRVPCPKCGQAMPIYDRLAERSWRHLSVMQYRLELRCAVPRCDCGQDGVKTMNVPWAEPGSRFTLHFEAFAVAVIAACRSLTQAAEWHANDVLNDRALDGDLGSDGSTPQSRAAAAGFTGKVTQTVAINPALAINNLDVINQWYYDPADFAIMSNCANTAIGVWSVNSLDRSVLVAVYGQPA